MGENYRIGQGIDVHKFADTIDKKAPEACWHRSI